MATLSTSAPKLVLGLDPGSNHTGYGLLKVGSGLELISQGRFSPPASWLLPRRLHYVYSGLRELLATFRPPEVAVEDIFYGKNVRSALKLGQVRGVLLLAAVESGAEVFEYAPRLVKSAVTGYGNAEKSQVAHMVTACLKCQDDLPPDAADALAIAICHANQNQATVALAPKRGRSWRQMTPEDLAALTGGKT